MSNRCKLSRAIWVQKIVHTCPCVCVHVCHVYVQLSVHRCVFRQRTARAASRAEDLLSLQTPEDKRRRTVFDVLGE